MGMRLSRLENFTACSAAVKATIGSVCPLIIVLTGTGHTAVSIARYSPKAPIIAISAGECSIKQLQCVRVMRPFVMLPRRHLLVEHEAKWQGKTMDILMSDDCVVAVRTPWAGASTRQEATCTHVCGMLDIAAAAHASLP